MIENFLASKGDKTFAKWFAQCVFAYLNHADMTARRRNAEIAWCLGAKKQKKALKLVQWELHQMADFYTTM